MPEPPTLRPLVLADFGSVLALWQTTEGIGLNESDTPEGLARFLDRNPGLSLVAVNSAGKIIATVLCGHDGRRGYLHHLAVAKPFRSQGLGRALVQRCLGQLRALGIAKCNLFLYAHNESGLAFWLHEGWSAREDLIVVQRST